MSDDECPHFGRPLDFPGECSICSGRDKRVAQEAADQLRTAVSAPFRAAYEGTCLVCHTAIEIDQPIVRNQADSYIHSTCSYGG